MAHKMGSLKYIHVAYLDIIDSFLVLDRKSVLRFFDKPIKSVALLPMPSAASGAGQCCYLV